MAKIVVVSNDNNLCSLLKNNIKGETIDTLNSLAIGARCFIPGDFNVLILDLDMPSIDFRLLKETKNRYNLLVILTGSDTKRAMDLIHSGYSEFIVKPINYFDAYTKEYVLSIVCRIKMIFVERGGVKPAASQAPSKPSFIERVGKFSAAAVQRQYRTDSGSDGLSEKVIGIASSTGGTEALVEVLKSLPANMPPILIVQHFPPNIVKSYAQRLDKLCALNIKVAGAYEYVERGTVYFADALSHMVLTKADNRLVLTHKVSQRVNGVIPAADVLFASIAEIMKDRAIGVVMTGMGSDGAKGLLMMRSAGAVTFAQDRETSMVYGMPKVSLDIGAASEAVALKDIAHKLIYYSKS